MNKTANVTGQRKADGIHEKLLLAKLKYIREDIEQHLDDIAKMDPSDARIWKAYNHLEQAGDWIDAAKEEA